MKYRNSDAEDELMEQNQVAFKDLAVFPDECGKCSNCSDIICKLCKSCLTAPLKATLREAFKEHTRRHLCRRVIPPTLVNITSKFVFRYVMLTHFYGASCRHLKKWNMASK